MPVKRDRPSMLDGQPQFGTSDYGVANRSSRRTTSRRGTERAAQSPFGLLRPQPPAADTRQPSADARRAVVALPRRAPALPAPDLVRQAGWLEALVKRHLEELHFSFDSEALDDLEGFFICEDGCRAIVAAADLDPVRRVFLYLHCLGHLALGHVDDRHLVVTHEFRDRWRLPPHEQARESAADEWALALLVPRPAGSPAAMVRHLQRCARRLRLPRGFARACVERLRGALAEAPALAAALRAAAMAGRGTGAARGAGARPGGRSRLASSRSRRRPHALVRTLQSGKRSVAQ